MGVRNYPDKPRVYVDMDGVLADFEAAARAAGMEPSHYKLVAGAYYSLPVMKGAVEAVARLEEMGFLVFSLTKIPSANPYSATEKLLWMRRNFPSIGERVIISPDKGAVGRDVDFLVDDRPDWANAKNFPGTVVHFKSWDEAIAFFEANHAAGTGF